MLLAVRLNDWLGSIARKPVDEVFGLLSVKFGLFRAEQREMALLKNSY